MGGIISFLLLSSISAMVIAGPRISRSIGEDYHLFRWLGKNDRKDIPVAAIVTQAVLTIFYILTATFDQVIVFVGFTLNLFTFMTVLGVMIVRKKHPELPRPYKTLGYPVVPILFLLINIWILVYGLMYRTEGVPVRDRAHGGRATGVCDRQESQARGFQAAGRRSVLPGNIKGDGSFFL